MNPIFPLSSINSSSKADYILGSTVEEVTDIIDGDLEEAGAGLALLVAMGMTSCKNTTEVDPNDPYNTTKPAQPGTSTKGGDLVFTITKTADLSSLWASYDATKKAELMKKTELNIVINSGSYKLDGGVLTLPAFFNTPANSVLNLTFNGNFQDADKNPLNLDASTNLAGAKVNIKVPAQEFDMGLDVSNVAATLSSDGAIIGTFAAAANTEKNNALSINSGVWIDGIDDASTGAIVKGGGEIAALIVNADPTLVNKKGFKIGNQETYTNSLIINAAGINVSGNNDTPLGDIIINKGCDVKFINYGTVGGVFGATKASECKVDLGGNDVNKIGVMEKVTLSNGGSSIDIKADMFTDVAITEYVFLQAGPLTDVELQDGARLEFTKDNESYSFENVKFASGYSVNIWGGIKVSQEPSKETYQWDINNKVWVLVTATAPITAANASDSGVDVPWYDVLVNSDGSLSDSNNKVGDHKVFTIVYDNATYILPENCTLNFDSKCTYGGNAIVDNNINSVVNSTSADPTWLTVVAGGTTYTYRKTNSGYTLVKK